MADELQSIFRLLRRPSEPSSDRQLVVHEANDVQSDSRDGREVFRAVARPVPQIVLSHLDVQSPVQAVLDHPMVSDGLQKLLGRHLLVHDAVADPGLGSALGLADGLEGRPLEEILQPADVVGDRRRVASQCIRARSQQAGMKAFPSAPEHNARPCR